MWDFIMSPLQLASYDIAAVDNKYVFKVGLEVIYKCIYKEQIEQE